MTKPTDPYAALRSDVITDANVIDAFCANEPIEQHLWHVNGLPGGSRVLLHGEEPVILYDGDADRFFFRGSHSAVLRAGSTSDPRFVRKSDDVFWENHKRLTFLARLRGGVDA